MKTPKTEEHKAKIRVARGTKVTVTNLDTNETLDKLSIRQAAQELNASHSTISKYAKSHEPLRYIQNRKDIAFICTTGFLGGASSFFKPKSCLAETSAKLFLYRINGYK
jgi:hypothetical protein